MNLFTYHVCSIPRNSNRLIDMKQSVTLTGLGAETFNSSVRGVGALYNLFSAELQRRGSRLRPWSPSHEGTNVALAFGNRYLTSQKDALGEQPLTIRDTIDPFDVLGPLLRTEVHLPENAVQYWQQVKDATTHR